MRPQILSEPFVIVCNWPQHLDLLLSYVLFQRFHVEVIKMSEVEIQLRHFLKRLSQIIVLETAVKYYVVAELRDLDLSTKIRKIRGRSGN